jgi:hypothetical protein
MVPNYTRMAESPRGVNRHAAPLIKYNIFDARPLSRIAMYPPVNGGVLLKIVVLYLFSSCLWPHAASTQQQRRPGRIADDGARARGRMPIAKLTVTSPGAQVREGETLPFRHPMAENGLLVTHDPSVATVYDNFHRSVRLFGI